DETTEKLLLPALADGQTALVLEAKWTSKQWQKALPETEKPMPMWEPALVLRVSDEAQLRRAVDAYRTIVDEALAKARELAPPGRIPELKVPDPEVRKVKAGTLYYYELPPQLGLDPQVTPTAGLSKYVAVLSLSQGQAERLMTHSPLANRGGPLGNTRRPL